LSQAFALFEWGMNWCVAKHANQYMSVHAAVVEKNGYAVIMAAPPGIGKSTLCAGLVANGWRLLSDELALISPEDVSLTPIPRPLSLKNDSIGIIRNFAPEMTIGPVARDTAKGIVAHMKAPEDSIARANEPAAPGWVVCPKYEQDAPARLERRSKARTFMYLVKNSFNYNVHGLRGYRTVASLIDRCDCYDFTYSRLEEAVEIFDGFEPPRAAVGG
jgi:HprK-related kinase A